MKKLLIILALVLLPTSAFAAWHINKSSITGKSVFNHTGLQATHFNTSFTPLNLAVGLVGWWTFDGKNLINNVADTSGQGNTGVLVAAATSTQQVAGVLGQALKFNGTTQSVTVANNSALDTNSLSISAWIKTSNTTSCLAVAGLDGGNLGMLLDVNTPGSSCTVINGDIAFWNGGGWVNAALGSGKVGDSHWHLVTGVTNATTEQIYWDGVQKGTWVATAVAGTNPFHIGKETVHNNFFNGSIDDVRVYNRALSAAEVQQLYNLGR